MLHDDIVKGFADELDRLIEDEPDLLAGVHAPLDAGRRAAQLLVAPMRWRAAIGPVIDTAALSDLLDVSRQAIAKRVARHQLLAIAGSASRLYPTWQFDGAMVRPVVGEILHRWYEAEPEVSPLTIAVWARTPSAVLNLAHTIGRTEPDTPADVIERGDGDARVLDAAVATIASRTS